jgi:hypothetical protein
LKPRSIVNHEQSSILFIDLKRQGACGRAASPEAASEQARTSLSEFVRRRALEAAGIDVLERCVVTIPAEDWEAFEAWWVGPLRPCRHSDGSRAAFRPGSGDRRHQGLG